MSAPARFERLLHPPLAEEVAALARMNAAYGRMIEATLKHDDAAYEEAKADFYGKAD